MTVTLSIDLFGALRPHSPTPTLKVVTDLPVSVADLRARIADRLAALDPGFDPDGIFKVSAIASERAVLPRDAVLTEPVRLALIPPVSGG